MREKVLKLFEFTCDKCGFAGYAGYPFVYEDKETNGGFLIYLEPDCEDREVGSRSGDLSRTTYEACTGYELPERQDIPSKQLDDRVIAMFKKMQDDDPEKIPDELQARK